MKVLSLFDGMSCGQLALRRVQIPYNTYYASEIDKHAIKLTQHHFPNTIQLGNVKDLSYNHQEKTLIAKSGKFITGDIDLFLAGNPCQSWSLAGKRLGTGNESGALFFDMIRLLKDVQPDYFLIENVRMKEEHVRFFSENIGVSPIIINSARVSAQNRVRCYWTNIPVDISKLPDYHLSLGGGLIQEDGDWVGAALRRRYTPESGKKTVSRLELRKDNKANTLLTVSTKSLVYNRHTETYRKFSQSELERLQTVPVGYTDILTYNQAHKLLANGWTVEVIAFLLQGLKG